MMQELGYILALRGYTLRSGGAKGADTAFYEGYKSASVKKLDARCEIFLPGYQFRGLFDNPRHGIFDTTRFPTWEAAGQLALSARGGAHGLDTYGISLHTRNVYQVMGINLVTPSLFIICSAPITRKGRGVKGGTNTAVQIGFAHHIPVWNLEDQRDYETISRFLMGDDVDLTKKEHRHAGLNDHLQRAEKLKREFQGRVSKKRRATGESANANPRQRGHAGEHRKDRDPVLHGRQPS